MILLATSAVDMTLRESIRLIVPEASLIATACVLFVVSTFKSNRRTAGAIALGGLGLAAVLHFSITRPADLMASVTPLLGDGLAQFIRLVALATGVLLVLLSWNEAGNRRPAEFQACLLCVVAGASLVGAANDLIFLFLALELISIPTYVLLYLPTPNDQLAQESAVKYFLLSLLSSAMLLFGFSYLYGISGSTNLSANVALLPSAAAGDMVNMALIAIVMIVAGLGFRITAFPFHFYAPDVYQGAPLSVVTLLSFVPKVAGFVALLRLFGAVNSATAIDYSFTQQYTMLLWILAAVSMTAGNVLALMQKNLRRMLAYSGVANAGYMLIGLAALPFQANGATDIVNGGDAMLFYLIAYGAMTVGLFAAFVCLGRANHEVHVIDDLAGMYESNPRMAILLAIFLFSMIGLPLTGGFVGKFYLFLSALAVRAPSPMGNLYQVLVVVAALNATVAAYYYMRVVSAMFLRGSFQPPVRLTWSPVLVVTIICAILTVLLGIFPSPLLNAVRSTWG